MRSMKARACTKTATYRRGQQVPRPLNKPLEHCRSFGKVRFEDRIAALLVLADIQRHDKSYRRHLEQRAYFCQECLGWHLTHKPLRASAARPQLAIVKAA